jgi:hypothetical protein
MQRFQLQISSSLVLAYQKILLSYLLVYLADQFTIREEVILGIRSYLC